ncbi:ATPase components of ABC transporters with duplicated ATPase domains [Streptomyces zhaozhouensis]|uniref:Virginiamycin B lyase n=1 Tax=Streptomyces zhaozhouensis TaxID=1300267 RepID=A0A286E6U2_9ACTN|nr:ATPase components of ABC transporters with duplicated ATPase domains [Streptomyces zhaozhouensis]
MRTQITAHDLTRTFDGRPVLDAVNCSFPAGERAAVVGENGSGKSTLLRLLAGVDRPDAGRVVVRAEGGVGHFLQEETLPADLTVQRVLDRSLAELRALEGRLRALEARMAADESAALGAGGEEYGRLLTVFELRGGYDADARLERALAGLGLAALPRGRRVGTLSGGELGRLRLAALLAAAPEVLLLDEPTNHLDDGAVDWLADHLRGRRGTTVLVSHDRDLLERVATTVWELDADRRRLVRHGGGYAGYLAEHAATRRRWAAAHAAWLAETERLTEAATTTARRVAPGRGMRDGNKMAYDRAGGRVQRSVAGRVRNAEERLRRLRADPVPPPPEPLRFRPTLRADALAGTVLAAEGLAVDGRLAPLDLAVEAGDRLLVTGVNGSGKSTLLSVLAGELAPDRGRFTARGRVARLGQEPPPALPGQTLLAAFAAGRPGTGEEHAERLLALGLFAAERFDVPVARLSTGQRQRLALARLVDAPVDVLLLDEPTNHLSPALVEEVEAALADYPGTVVVVSHDRRLRARWRGTRLSLTPARPPAAPAPSAAQAPPAPPSPWAAIEVPDGRAGGPYALALGPDGALWFTLVHAGAVGRLAPDGRIDTHPLDDPGCAPTVIAPGPDGALWFTRYGDHRVGRIDTRGRATSFAPPTPESGPYGIAAGPDGALWFTQSRVDRVGRITVDGRVDEFPLPWPGAFPAAIVAGPDGALWCTLNQADALARITVDGRVSRHPLPTEGAAPVGLTVGADGALWCAEIGAGQLARMTADGRVDEFPLPDRGCRPHAVLHGPDGRCWYTAWAAGRIGAMDAEGKVEEFPLDDAGSEPHGLAFDAAGALHVALESGTLAVHLAGGAR